MAKRVAALLVIALAGCGNSGAGTGKGGGGGGSLGGGGGGGPMPPRFDVIPPLPGHDEIARQVGQPDAVESGLHYVSADGSAAVGPSRLTVATLETEEVFVWTRAGGSEPLGRLGGAVEGQGRLSTFYGAGRDASVIVGSAMGSGLENIGYRWTRQSGMVELRGPADDRISGVDLVSEDGTTVGMVSIVGDAFIWTEAGGAIKIGAPVGLDGSTNLLQLSANGSAAFGTGYFFEFDATGNVVDRTQPYRWTAQTGTVGLGALAGHTNCEMSFVAESWNGDAVLGTCVQPDFEKTAFIWTEALGLTRIDGIPGFGSYEPRSASADGRTVVGTTASTSGAVQPFRWTPDGITGLGYVAGETRCEPQLLRDAISRDGSVVAGFCLRNATAPFKGFVWSTANGLRALAPLDGKQESFPAAVSPDGSLVVGGSTGSDGVSVATAWDLQGTPRSIAAVLQAAGVDLQGVILKGAGAAPDAKVVAGSGEDATGRLVSWVARLP